MNARRLIFKILGETETKQAQIVTAAELNERIQAHLQQFDTDKAKWKACKGLLKWRFYSPQLNLWAGLGGLGGLEIIPVTDPSKATVFDARDNAEFKQRFYTTTTGIAWSIELCASESPINIDWAFKNPRK